MQKNCLIIDDSRLSRIMLKKILHEHFPDIVCIEASSGAEGIKLVKRQLFAYVFLDFNMPVMNGGEVAEVIRPLMPESKIAFLTANIQESIKKMAKDLQIDFIAKPITEEKIINYVNS